jgi:hypothetical protein
MAWFLVKYKCEQCDETWEQEWSCCCDDECPSCGVNHEAINSECKDLSVVVELSPQIRSGIMSEYEAMGYYDRWNVFVSSRDADDDPDYSIRGFKTRKAADRYAEKQRARLSDAA